MMFPEPRCTMPGMNAFASRYIAVAFNANEKRPILFLTVKNGASMHKTCAVKQNIWDRYRLDEPVDCDFVKQVNGVGNYGRSFYGQAIKFLAVYVQGNVLLHLLVRKQERSHDQYQPLPL